MKKFLLNLLNILKIIIFLSLLFFFIESFAKGTDMGVWSGIENVSKPAKGGNIIDVIKGIAISLLTTSKYILMGLFVIFMVYTGIMMISSRGSDEEELSKSKRQIWYSIVAILFINIPGTIYESFNPTKGGSANGKLGYTSWLDSISPNLFINTSTFTNTLGNKIIGFLEVTIFGIAVFFIILSGIKILTSRGRDDQIKESKMKIIYSVFALIFVGLIETWKNFAWGGDIGDGKSFFSDAANLALFLAAPVAIFFLTMAGYYFVVSAGDEEKIKKAKSIVINTVIATIILLAAYTFLLDLATL